MSGPDIPYTLTLVVIPDVVVADVVVEVDVVVVVVVVDVEVVVVGVVTVVVPGMFESTS